MRPLRFSTIFPLTLLALFSCGLYHDLKSTKAELETKTPCQIFYREIQSDEARNQQFLLDMLMAWSDLDLQ